MPKIINHENQKEKIAEAVWRIIISDGMEKATVRNIAEEAGLSMGAMRYYFSSQEELFVFCMNLIRSKTEKRIKELKFSHSDPPLQYVKQALSQLLPLDKERRIETEVWFSFTAKSLCEPELRDLCNQMYEDIHIIVEQSLDIILKFGIAKPNLDIKIETERLYAFIDGLCVHCILKPDELTPAIIDTLLTHHLELLCIAKDVEGR